MKPASHRDAIKALVQLRAEPSADSRHNYGHRKIVEKVVYKSGRVDENRLVPTDKAALPAAGKSMQAWLLDQRGVRRPGAPVRSKQASATAGSDTAGHSCLLFWWACSCARHTSAQDGCTNTTAHPIVLVQQATCTQSHESRPSWAGRLDTSF